MDMDEVNGIALEEAQRLLLREARLLDERRFEDWEALFTADGYYWVPLRPEQDGALDELSLVFDDRQLMRERIRRLRHPRVHVDTPKRRTVHFVSNVELERASEANVNCLALSTLLVAEYRTGDVQRLFAGRCRHGLRREGDALRIAWKRIDLVNCDDVFDPVVLPL